MTIRELFARHRAEMDDGTALQLATVRLNRGSPTIDDLVAIIRWELWECLYHLPPMSAPEGELLNSMDEPATVTDAWHASACAARVDAMLRQLWKLQGVES